jgi:magnesium transporter
VIKAYYHQGWIGCVLCIIGATILALNAPEQQSVTTIVAFKKLFLSVGFLVWGCLLIVTSLVIIFFVAPRWGKTHMLPYIAVCSLIGGISVSCTQGLGASIVTSIQGYVGSSGLKSGLTLSRNNQVKNWFFWFLFVFVVITLLTEYVRVVLAIIFADGIRINYLNKALELYNAAVSALERNSKGAQPY